MVLTFPLSSFQVPWTTRGALVWLLSFIKLKRYLILHSVVVITTLFFINLGIDTVFLGNRVKFLLRQMSGQLASYADFKLSQTVFFG